MDDGNTFADKSSEYAESRPTYPPALFDWIKSQCAKYELAWDVATGSGQAAVGVSQFFKEVVASDISAEQIAFAVRRPNVSYRVSSAEHSGLVDKSVNLITVAQALHWFEFDPFWKEVSRVGAADSFFCAWGYDWLYVNPVLDELLVRPFREIIAPFWSAKNRILWNGYLPDEVSFPFVPIPTPSLEIEVFWDAQRIISYMETWSAYKRSLLNPDSARKIEELKCNISRICEAGEVFRVTMPLKILAAKVNG